MAVVRRQLVKQQPVARSSVPRVGLFHAHGCLDCGQRYQDTCAFPLKNNLCAVCRGSQAAPSKEDLDRQPRDCCANGGSRLITDVDVLSKYNLGGPGPWFLCRTCARTHPFDPIKKETP